MKHILLIGLLLTLSISVSALTAAEIDSINCQSLTYQGKPIKDAQIALPKEMADFLNGESVTMSIDGGSSFSGIVSNGILSNISCTLNPNATMVVMVSGYAVEKISNSSNPLKTLKQMKTEGQITFVPQGIVAQGKALLLAIVLLFI